jgi:hypothetical protein
MAEDNKTDAGVPDTQLTNLTRQELMKELQRRGRSTDDIMNKKNLTGPELEAIYTLNEGMAMGGSVNKKRIGANDYRKGGYVLSTMDNRKVKRNGK